MQAGIVGEIGEQRKDAKHDANVARVGGCFIPLVVETLGVWTQFALEELRKIAARTTLNSGLSASTAAKHLIQQLSVKLWAYNAKMHLALLPLPL